MTDATVRRMAGLRPGRPVLSLYLDLDPERFGTAPARSAAIRSLLDSVHRAVERHDGDHDERTGLREDAERVAGYFRDEFSAKGVRGVALFSASRADLFEAVTLSRPVDTRVVIDGAPYVEPLVSVSDAGSWFVVLVNRREARFLRGTSDRLDEAGALSDDVPGQHDQGGWSQAGYERSIEHDVDVHLGNVADAVRRRLRRESFDGLLVGGPAELVPRFEAALHHDVARRLAGRIEVDVANATADEVLDAARPRLEEHRRRRERDALDRLAQGIGGGGRAAAGIADVRRALEERRVEILLYTPGFDSDGIEAAVHDALAQDAQVLRVEHHDDLGPLGGIGAVLRF